MWPDNRIQNLFGIALRVVQAPMAGVAFSEMAILRRQGKYMLFKAVAKPTMIRLLQAERRRLSG